MGAPGIRRRRNFAAKVENPVGTAVSLAAADAVWNVFNPRIEPTIQYIEREGQGSALSALPGVLAEHSGTATFSTELIGGTAPPLWASAALLACGYAVNTGTFTPESRPPEVSSSGAKTLTIGCYEDGVLKKIAGAMGNAVFRFVSGRPVMIDFAFPGVWAAPTDVALLAPTYVTTAPLRFVSSSLTIGTATPKCYEMTIDTGNTITLRQDSTTSTGLHSAVVVARRVRGTMKIESGLVATYDPHGDMLARTERQLSLTLGTAGNAVAFTIPKFQITGIRPGEANGIACDEIEWQANRSASAGDDEISIAIS
jgi:hypothetical protein